MRSIARGSLAVAALLACQAAFAQPQNTSQNGHNEQTFQVTPSQPKAKQPAAKFNAPSQNNKNNTNTKTNTNANNTSHNGSTPDAFRIFMSAVSSLKTDSAGATKFTSEQVNQINQFTKSFESKMLEYRSAHQAEYSSLQAKTAMPTANTFAAVTKTDGNVTTIVSTTPDLKSVKAPIRAAEAQAAQARAQLNALAKNAPKTTELYGQIWKVLTPEQRQYTTNKFLAARTEWVTNNGGKFAFQTRNEKFFSSFPAEFRQKLQSMNPQQRSQAIRDYNERRQSNAGGDQ